MIVCGIISMLEVALSVPVLATSVPITSACLDLGLGLRYRTGGSRGSLSSKEKRDFVDSLAGTQWLFDTGRSIAWMSYLVKLYFHPMLLHGTEKSVRNV